MLSVSSSTHTQQWPPPVVQGDDTTVIRFVTGPEPPKVPPYPVLSPELTYGCVEWFDYKRHPLKTKDKTT